MDIPVTDDEAQKEVPVVKKTLFPEKNGKLTVTQENAAMLTVHFLSQIYARLGYVVKLLEEKKED